MRKGNASVCAIGIQGEIVQSPIGRIEAARFGIIDVSVSDASRSANLAIIRWSRIVEVVMYRVLTTMIHGIVN
jgi:hypothetical protein